MRIVIKISFHIAVAISVTLFHPNYAIAASGTGAFGGLSSHQLHLLTAAQ
jgi:hypothetical protein